MKNNPFIKDAKLVEPKRSADGGMGVVVLDRVEPGVLPEYCTHGKTSCYACDEWCWLGDKTYEVVVTGRAAGLCIQCANRMLPPDARDKYFVENVHDHRRADGPH